MKTKPALTKHVPCSAARNAVLGRTLTINGAERCLHATTMAGMVEEMGLPAPLLLVEHNGHALRKSEWEGTPLRDGDRIEILRISAGG